jgi:hypothetical protein
MWANAAAMVLVSAFSLAGCAIVTIPQAPGAMNVSVEIQAYQRGSAHIVVRFATARNDTIEFASGETVACDGQFLRYSLGSYVGDVPHQPGGGVYTITYTPGRAPAATAGTAPSGANSDASPIVIQVPVVDAPVTVLQPTVDAVVPVPTNTPLTVTYQPSTLADTQISAAASDGRWHVTWYLPEPDSGSYSLPADTFSSFQGGPGLITMARVTSSQVGGTPFGSVRIQFKNITQVPVTWQ